MSANAHQRLFSHAQIFKGMRIGIAPCPTQHGRQHIGWAIHHHNAAARQARRIFRLQQHIKAIQRQIRRDGFYAIKPQAKPHRAPQINRPMAIAGINFRHTRHQCRIKIAPIRNACAIKRRKRAGAEQPREARLTGRHNNVIARTPGGKLAFQRFQTVIDIIAHASAGLSRKPLHDIGVYVIGPVIDIHHTLLREGDAWQNQKGKQDGQAKNHGRSSAINGLLVTEIGAILGGSRKFVTPVFFP